MTPFARGLAYVAALMLAFAGIAPWVTMRAAIGGASPVGVAVVLVLSLAVVVATVLRRRTIVRVVGLLTAAFAVYVIYLAPDQLLVNGDVRYVQITGTGVGLRAMMFSAVLAFAAASLPARAPRRNEESGQPAPGEPG